MMQNSTLIWISVFMMTATSVFSQSTQPDSTYRKFYVGGSMFMLSNLNVKQKNPPDFIQLNFGYRLTPKDVISVEFKTWKYGWPLGIPFGDSFEAPEEKYPGYIRSFGVALVYQRFIWKGAYAAVHAMNSSQRYFDENNNKIQNGYMLFVTGRVGYHFQFFKNRFFVEPSVAMTSWPVNTNVPESFATLDKKWSKVFFPEPGLHFGVKF